MPTPNPTRTPIVVVTLGMSGITCDDFNQTVYDLAMDSVVSNSTFSEADCTTTATGSDPAVSVTSELTMPLVIIANTYGDGSGESVMSHVTTLLVTLDEGFPRAMLPVAHTPQDTAKLKRKPDASIEETALVLWEHMVQLWVVSGGPLRPRDGLTRRSRH